MITRRFEYTFFEYFKQFERRTLAKPLNLGGTSGEDGGAGGPPGGFIGYLPQTRVAYDTTEAASSGLPASGQSLLDNLNHIRYRINMLEENGVTSVYEDDILVASGVTILNFEGDVDVVDNGNGNVTITVSGGIATDEQAKVSVDDTTTNYLESKVVAGSNVTITVLNPGGNEQLEISAAGSGLGTDELVKIGVSDTTANYLENKVVAGTGINVSVLNDGSNEQLEISAELTIDNIISYAVVTTNSVSELATIPMLRYIETDVDLPHLIVGYSGIDWSEIEDHPFSWCNNISYIGPSGSDNYYNEGLGAIGTAGVMPSLYLFKGRGTILAPEYVQTDDYLGRIYFAGYNSTDGYYESIGWIEGRASKNFNTSEALGYLDFRIMHSSWTDLSLMKIDRDQVEFHRGTYIYGNYYRRTFEISSTPYTVSTNMDTNSIFIVDASTNIVINLPAAASSTHRVLTFKKKNNNANTVTLDGNGSETIDGATTLVLSAAYAKTTIVCTGSTWYVID